MKPAGDLVLGLDLVRVRLPCASQALCPLKDLHESFGLRQGWGRISCFCVLKTANLLVNNWSAKIGRGGDLERGL